MACSLVGKARKEKKKSKRGERKTLDSSRDIQFYKSTPRMSTL